MSGTWVVEVCDKNGEWEAMHPTGELPYLFDSKDEAEHIRRILYPHEGLSRVRVRELMKAEYAKFGKKD